MSAELIEDIIEAFPGFITDEDVNGGDLVDYIAGVVARYEENRPKPPAAQLVTFVCDQCGGSEISVEAFVEWCDDSQEFIVTDTCDKGHHCATCDGMCRLKQIPLKPET